MTPKENLATVRGQSVISGAYPDWDAGNVGPTHRRN